MTAAVRAELRRLVDQARREKIALERARASMVTRSDVTSHGAAGYAKRCRCRACQAGHTAAQRASRRRAKAL